MTKGSWKTSLTFALQRFKNNIQSCISVSVRAMGKATIMTSKAHYAIFVKGEGWWTEIELFSSPLHVQTKLSIQQRFPITALSSQTWKS